MLLFGYKSENFFQSNELFSDMGLAHLFTISGTQVIAYLYWFRYVFLRLGVTQEKVFWCQLLASFCYAGLVGFSISIIRVLLQQSISLINQRFELGLSRLDCWSLSLLTVLVSNPMTMFSIGTQFSFGLSFFSQYIFPIVQKIKSRFLQKLCSSCLLNLVAIPFIGIIFFEWQITSSLLSMFIFPVLKKILLPLLTIQFILSLFWVSPVLIDGLEKYFMFQIKLFEWLNQHVTIHLVIGACSAFLFVWLMCLILVFLSLLSKRSLKCWFVLGVFFLSLQTKYLCYTGQVSFVDIGQGDSIFIQAPFNQETILIDTGGQINFEKETWKVRKKLHESAVISYLKSRGVSRLDKVFITHGHVDHFGDLLSIGQKIPIKILYYPAGTDNKPLFKKTIEALKQMGTVCIPIRGPAVVDGSVSFKVLAPTQVGEGENKDSLVLLANLGTKNLLFTGDIGQLEEKKLIETYPNLSVDILKIGHHGSKTSTSEEFIQQLEPIDSIISCGNKNLFGHPHIETLNTFQRNEVSIFRTDQQGMIYYEWTMFSPLSSAKYVMNK